MAGLPKPFELTVPLEDGSELERSCVGQPSETSLLERMLAGKPACASTLECRYWDEAAGRWSTDGCATRVYNGTDGGGAGFVGCACSHLSDFVAVKVPTRAYGDMHFGQIDASSLTTTNVQCTQGGLWLTLRKGQDDAPPLRRALRVAYTEADGAPLGWKLLNLTCAAVPGAAAGGGAGAGAPPQRCAWLRALVDAGATHGNASDEHVQLEADARGKPTPCNPMPPRLQPATPCVDAAAPLTLAEAATSMHCAGLVEGSPLYLPYISPISPLYLPYISPISPLYLARPGGGCRGRRERGAAAALRWRRHARGAGHGPRRRLRRGWVRVRVRV